MISPPDVSQGPTRAIAAEPQRPRVMCVSASAERRSRIGSLLEGGHQVALAGGSAEGLRLAKATPPAAVLCDAELPGTSGLQVLLALKGDPALQAVPFIVMGACEGDAAAYLEAGVHDFLCGSPRAEEVRARVGAAVRSYKLYEQVRAERRELTRIATLFAKSEARTRAVVESANDGILLLAADGRIEAMNGAAERMFGLSRQEALGRNFLQELVAPGARDAVAECWVRGRAARAPGARPDHRGLRRGGEEFPIECKFSQLGSGAGAEVCAFVRDLTEEQALQLELQQSQKLEAVGRLAAGIAHEINTPIQYVGDNTQFLEGAFGALLGLVGQYTRAVRPEAAEALRQAEEQADLAYLGEQIPKTIARTLQGVQRVATIVRAMREFAHPDQREMVATDLNRAVQATLEVARNEYKYVADVVTDLGELPPVTCHAGDLNQVVLNIVVNAAHAIGDAVRGTRDRGTITVATRCDGPDALIRISDTGPGIPEAIRDKVFEPFFTTKEVGRGTGQGLAIARSIVAKHHGSIGFETAVGQGTTFVIRVPLRQAEAGP